MKKYILIIFSFILFINFNMISDNDNIPYEFEVNKNIFIEIAIKNLEELNIISKSDNYKNININNPIVSTFFYNTYDYTFKIVIIFFPLNNKNGFTYTTLYINKDNSLNTILSCGSSFNTINDIIKDQSEVIFQVELLDL